MGRPYKRTSEVKRYFKRNKCYIVKHGAEHDIWENSKKNGGQTQLTRGSKGVGKGIYFDMCKDLGIRP